MFPFFFVPDLSFSPRKKTTIAPLYFADAKKNWGAFVPHLGPRAEASWKIEGEDLRLTVRPLVELRRDVDGKLFGCPVGSKDQWLVNGLDITYV